jgi:hypothetical protein
MKIQQLLTMSKSMVMPLILLLAVMVFVKGAKGPVKDLTAEETKQKLGGVAKILVDCPRNEKNECEPPISVSFETPNSKNTYFCQENKDGPEYGDVYESDEEFTDDYVSDYTYDTYEDVDTFETTTETIYYTWRLKSDTANAVTTLDPENDNDIFGVLPCETIDVAATSNVYVKYRHCKYDPATMKEQCAALKTKEIKVASYDPTKISDTARPKQNDGLVYFRSGVKFKGSSGNLMFPAFKFNTTGFQFSLASALNSARTKCKPGEEKCEIEFDEVVKKNIRVLNVDDSGNKKDVLFEVRVPTEDGVDIQNRLLHPYFKYPLAAKLAMNKLIPHYNYEPQLEVDSSKAVLLEPVPEKKAKSLISAKMAAGIIAVIVVGAISVVVGLVVVGYKASQNKKMAQQLDTKSAQLNIKSAQLDAEGKKIAARYNELLQREKELNDKFATLKVENEKMEAEKKRLDAEEQRIQAEHAEAQSALQQAQESGDTTAVEKAKLDMSAIAAKLSTIGKKKKDCSAEVDRLTAEQERVKKELDQEVLKQKETQHRKLQERLAKRKKKNNVKSSSIKPMDSNV